MTDAERFVKQRYPMANCEGQWINGKRVRESGWWIVRSGEEPPWSSSVGSIGKGLTMIAAWADAANRIEKREPVGGEAEQL